MAQLKTEIKNTYPLPVYNYRVTITDSDAAPTISFSEVSGLSMEYEAVIYKHGFSYQMGDCIIPGMRQPLRLTCKKGIVMRGSYLHDWLHNTHHQPFYDKDKRDILVDLCDEAGTPLVRWKVRGAMPVKLDAPTFDANASEVAIESMEWVGQGLTIEYL